MGAPLIGMSFPSFLVLLILSAVAAAVAHGVFRYRLQPLEQLLVGRLHRFILDGMLASLASVANAGSLTQPPQTVCPRV